MVDTLLGFVQTYGPRLVGAVIVLLIGFAVKSVFLKMTKRFLAKSRIDKTLHGFIVATVNVLLLIVIVMTVANTLGIPIATLITALGACGVAISLALKDSLSNVAAGILILFNKPFAVGDFVEIGSNKGNIVSIGLSYTQLNTVDNKAIFVPNSQVSTQALINYSKEPIRRVDRVFSISYSDDFERAKKIILDTAKASPYALANPEPFVSVAEHNSSSVDIVCRVWVENANYFSFDFYMLEQVKKNFDAAGISIPYPQLDLHVVESAATA